MDAALPAATAGTRVALLGGSFNPPHLGHALLAQAVLAVAEVDAVWVLPTAEHPFGKALAPLSDRMAMCELAFRHLGDAVAVSEIERLLGALASHSDQRVANAVRLLLLTGARRTEVLGATWDQFDLESGFWIKPLATTKQARVHRVPLSRRAMELLQLMRSADEAGHFVFPGRSADKPLNDIKKSWASICKAAKLDGVRLHDLRHTYASHLRLQDIKRRMNAWLEWLERHQDHPSYVPPSGRLDPNGS